MSIRKIEYGPRLKEGTPYLAGQKHPKTKVKFNRRGFPIFKSYFTFKIKTRDYKQTRSFHFSKASKALYLKALKHKKLKSLFTKKELELFRQGLVPERFTWHHHQTNGKMQLVSSKIHATTNHIGGYSFWGE